MRRVAKSWDVFSSSIRRDSTEALPAASSPMTRIVSSRMPVSSCV
ncbi:hypothetical protein FJZ36_01675 [Candidatus Poribacteria bacterium]|nr:hypothetical protein [Candidatus Poribacteria bacterium]